MAMSRSFGATSLTTRPPMAISPPVMFSSPAIIRSSVDFPHPEGPTRMTNSPSAISRSTLSTAMVPSANRLETPFRTISDMSGSALHCAGGEPGDDAPLEDQHHDDDGNGDDNRCRRDCAGGLRELGRAGEEVQRCRHRAAAVG